MLCNFINVQYCSSFLQSWGPVNFHYQYTALQRSLLLRLQPTHVAEEVCKVNIVCRGWRQYGVR